MPEVSGGDCVSAWQAAVRHVRASHGKAFNLVITVEHPTLLVPAWMVDYNPRRIVPSADNIRDVVNTVFPYRLAGRCRSRPELYDSYLRAYERGRHLSRNRGAWGTYFQRLIRFGADPTTNQLERAIEKLATWNHRVTTGLVFHPSSPALDSPRTRGGPCWQFGELLWHAGDIVDFLVVYRNHDYFNQGLGNLIALGKLLQFICDNAHKRPAS